jgi:hypothetical protein
VSGLYRNVTLNDNEFCVGGSGTAILYILGVEAEAYAFPGCAVSFLCNVRLRVTLDLVVEAKFDCGDNCHW